MYELTVLYINVVDEVNKFISLIILTYLQPRHFSNQLSFAFFNSTADCFVEAQCLVTVGDFLKDKTSPLTTASN